MKSRSILSCLLVLIMMAAFAFSLGCAEDKPKDQTPEPLQTDASSDKPSYENTEAEPTTTEFTSSSDDATDPDTPLFDIYTAELMIPALAACMESAMLSYPGSSVFPTVPVTDDAAYAMLYAYAQANFYVDGAGTAMSTYEITELLRLVYGDAYTYEDFEKAVTENDRGITKLDDAWDFGVGECYPPTITYAAKEDLPLAPDTAYYFNYTATFDDEQSGQIAVYVEADDSLYSVRIVRIEIVK